MPEATIAHGRAGPRPRTRFVHAVGLVHSIGIGFWIKAPLVSSLLSLHALRERCARSRPRPRTRLVDIYWQSEARVQDGGRAWARGPVPRDAEASVDALPPLKIIGGRVGSCAAIMLLLL